MNPTSSLPMRELALSVPLKVSCDLLVAGGGPAGIAAAIAGARRGADTVLIEQYGCVGGMATTGLVGPFMTSFDKEGREEIVRGIYRELVERMMARGGALDPASVRPGSEYVSFIHPYHGSACPFDPEVMKVEAARMLLEAGVNVRLHTRVVQAFTADGSISEVLADDKAGLFVARARLYVDATGDGDVAASAGNPFEKGRAEDGRLQPATMFMRIGGVDDAKVRGWVQEHPGERLFESLVSRAREDGRFPADLPREAVGLYRQLRPGEWRVNTSRLLAVDGTDPESLSRAEIDGRRQAQELMEFFHAYCPGLEHAYLIDTGAQVGIRETRRIRGMYTLTRRDVEGAARFEDAIARYAFFMDIHNPSGQGQEGNRRLGIEGGAYFEIPYRCLVASDTANLLVAGRCLSADHQANGAIRVMPACFATGQAAGTAAAMALEGRCAPARVDGLQVRQELRRDGCAV